MPNQDLRGFTFEDRFEDLFDQAQIADRMLGQFIARVCRHRAGQVNHARLKSRASARDKLLRDEKTGMRAVPDDPGTLKDIARATIVYAKPADLYAACDFIARQEEYRRIAHEQDTMKDRYRRSAPVPSGYRDIKFFLSFCTNPENPFAKRYHVCELQLNLTTMVIAKELEHPLYDILRQAGSRDHPTPVTITSPQEIERLGAKLRSVWVTLKQRQILSSAGDLAAFRGLVAKFFRDGDPAAGPITVSVNEIRMLQRLTPEIYEAYTKLSLDAKVMGPSGLRSMTTYRQQNAMTKPKGR